MTDKKFYEDKQEELITKICLDNTIDISRLNTVAGVDLAYWKYGDKEYACCCIIVLDYKTLSIIEKKYSVGEITVPYIPGCLAFREYGLVEKTVALLENEVDLYVFDGNGYLHPRHMGLATYSGIMLDKPSVGVAKSFYKFADVDYSDLPDEANSYKDIVIEGEVYGRVLRTHKAVKPVFVSIGNRISLDVATNVIEHMVLDDSHIPVPTRYADMMTHEIRKEYEGQI